MSDTAQEREDLLSLLISNGVTVKEGTPLHIMRKMAKKYQQLESPTVENGSAEDNAEPPIVEPKQEEIADEWDEVKHIQWSKEPVKEYQKESSKHKYFLYITKNGRRRKFALVEEVTPSYLKYIYSKI